MSVREWRLVFDSWIFDFQDFELDYFHVLLLVLNWTLGTTEEGFIFEGFLGSYVLV